METVNDEVFTAFIQQVMALNKDISEDPALGKGFQIGHSYFCLKEDEAYSEEWLQSVLIYDILPTLQEYWFDDTEKQCIGKMSSGAYSKNESSIIIRNIFYMLSYAFRVLREGNYADILTEDFEHVEDLLAAILSRGIAMQLKQRSEKGVLI